MTVRRSGLRGQHRLQLAKSLPHGRDTRPHVRAERIEDFGCLGLRDDGNRRRRRFELATGPPHGQSPDKNELLDPLNVLDVALSVQPRTVGRLPTHADARKLLLPGTEHVWLYLHQLADFHGFIKLGVHSAQYKPSLNWCDPQTAASRGRRRVRTWKRMGVPSKPKRSR